MLSEERRIARLNTRRQDHEGSSCFPMNGKKKITRSGAEKKRAMGGGGGREPWVLRTHMVRLMDQLTTVHVNGSISYTTTQINKTIIYSYIHFCIFCIISSLTHSSYDGYIITHSLTHSSHKCSVHVSVHVRPSPPLPYYFTFTFLVSSLFSEYYCTRVN